MKLLDAHGIPQARPGGPADRLCLSQDLAQFVFDRLREERLGSVDTRCRNERSIPHRHQSGYEQ
jgi:hypothetical protein